MQKYVGAVIDVCGSGSDTNLTKNCLSPNPMGHNEMFKAPLSPTYAPCSPWWGGFDDKCITIIFSPTL
jgi:hypothetical protein